MSSEDQEQGEPKEQEGKSDVIKWEESLEDHTLAVLEGDLEEDSDADFDSDEVDGREGVAKTNTQRYVTDFNTELEFNGSNLELSVERSGGLNEVEYWSNDPEAMAEFEEYIDERKKSVEEQPMLQSYKFEDVPSPEVKKLVGIYEGEFELEGPLPRGSNGQPRMHMIRAEDVLGNENDYKHVDEEERTITGRDQIPGDAKYVIEGLSVPVPEDVEGKLEIKPQKHDKGLYTVKLKAEDPDSQAYMINTALRAIDAEEDDISIF